MLYVCMYVCTNIIEYPAEFVKILTEIISLLRMEQLEQCDSFSFVWFVYRKIVWNHVKLLLKSLRALIEIKYKFASIFIYTHIYIYTYTHIHTHIHIHIHIGFCNISTLTVANLVFCFCHNDKISDTYIHTYIHAYI